MKTSFNRSFLGALALAIVVPLANAIPINITNNGSAFVGDVSKGLLGDNNPSTHLAWLTTQVSGYNSFNDPDLPAPVNVVDASAGMNGAVNLTNYTYATLHYGKGNGGIGDGGGVVAYYLNGATSFTFPQNGLGPNGKGGISTLYLYGPGPSRVPDGGSTAVLLGFSLIALFFGLRRRSS